MTGTAWYEGAIVGFDLETTGVDPFSDHIIQVGLDVSTWIPFKPEGIQVPLDMLSSEHFVNPGVPITNSDIHGITDADVADGLTEERTIIALSEFLLELTEAGIPIVIFNAPFDWTFLRVKMEEFGLTWDLDDARIIDPLVCDRHFDKFRKGKGMRKQGKVAGIYGLPENPEAHTARADAAEAVAISRAMARKYPAMQSGAMFAPFQEGWAIEQQMSLQFYFDRSLQKNEDGSRIKIDIGWPLRSHPEWNAAVPVRTPSDRVVAKIPVPQAPPRRIVKDSM